jgi:hypothetical protein
MKYQPGSDESEGLFYSIVPRSSFIVALDVSSGFRREIMETGGASNGIRPYTNLQVLSASDTAQVR